MNIAVIPYSPSKLNNQLFEADSGNHDYLRLVIQPYGNLKKMFEREGISFSTIDCYSSMDEIDWFLSFNGENDSWIYKILKAGKGGRLIYYMLEPEVVLERHRLSRLGRLKKNFPYIITYHDGMIDQERVFKCNYLYDFEMYREQKEFDKKKLLVSISGYKQSANSPRELYSERKKVIDYMEKYSGLFDFYGRGWPSTYKNYRGECADKAVVYQNYKFSLCFENGRDIPGYITEKLFDCFCAGIVPVYYGANNVGQYIPEECYIDYRKFRDTEGLIQYLSEMDPEEYGTYIRAIDHFLESEDTKQFHEVQLYRTLRHIISAGGSEKFKVSAAYRMKLYLKKLLGKI